MKIHFVSGKKAYVCDNPDCKNEGAEVYSLICRRIDGEDWDICESCFYEEVEE